MNNHNRLKDALRALCAQQHPDDAPEPRREQSSRRSPRVQPDLSSNDQSSPDSAHAASQPPSHPPTQADRKQHALAGQIREILDTTLRLSIHDPALEGASILAVELDHHGIATVAVVASNTAIPAETVRQRLVAAKGLFRAELARVLARKRIPSLAFIVLPPTPTPPESTPDV